MSVLSLDYHLPHNTPHIPSRYNNEQTTKQTKAINNLYIYIYIHISCKCDTNRAGHFTLDAYASRPVACYHYYGHFPSSMNIYNLDETCLVHGPEQISVPSGWAKLGNVFHVHICPVHYLSLDRPLKLAAFMWLSSIFNILFSKNSIFVFFDDFQIIFKLRPSSMTALIIYNCSNTSWYPFELYVSISLKKCSNCEKFMQKFLPFHNQ